MSEFFSTDSTEINRRLQTAFDQATDQNGERLFPNHEIPGSPGYNLRQLLAAEIIHWHREADTHYRAMSPITANGIDLERWAEFFGVGRGKIRYATGEVELRASINGSDMQRLLQTREVPEGTVLTAGSGTELRTLESVMIPENARTITVRVQAERPGPRVQVPVGTQLGVDAGRLSSELSARTTTAVNGGRSQESDDQLRARLARALRSETTYDGFEAKLLAHPDVAEVQMGQNTYGPGTIESFVVPATDLPEDGLRRELEGLWTGVGAAYVLFPDYEAVQLKIRVDGTADTEALARIINNLDLGEQLVLNQLEARIQNDGAADAQVIGAKRGGVDMQGNLINSRELTQVTNLTLPTPRSKWYTRPDWITICA